MLLLLGDLGGQTAELVEGAINLTPQFLALVAIHLGGDAGQPPTGPAGDRHHHL